MAGVAWDAYVDDDLGWDVAADYIGQTVGLGVPFKQYPPTPVLEPPEHVTGGEITSDGGGGAKPAGTEFELTNPDLASGIQDWFDRVHALPRSTIEFGLIVTLVEEEFELYSAYRLNTSTTLSLITNNVTPGVEFPEVAAPLVVPPLTSVLDSSSTDNSGGTGLGTLVLAKVQATQDGLPAFDDSIDFTFSTGDEVFILLSGTRIVLMPFEFEAPVDETLAFLTDIITGLDGKEQRIALRKQPRQLFEIDYKLDGNDRQRMQALLMDQLHNTFGLPLWHEKLRLTSAVSIGATTYPVAGADDVDLREGGFAAIITDPNTFDVIRITSPLNDTTITAQDPSQFAYPAGTPIMPMRAAIIPRPVRGTRWPVELEAFRVAFEVTDNDTGALTADASAFSTYNGRVLLDDCNVIDGTMTEEFSRRVYRVDNQTGVVSQSTGWDKFKRMHGKGFVARSRADIKTLRQLLLSFRGRQVAFYIPTFIEDLEVVDDLTNATDTMDVERIGYGRFIQDREPKATFRITFTDGSSLVRVVQSSADVDATTERLTLDTTWPADRTVDEIERVQFYEPARFDTDTFKLRYPRIGRAIVRDLPVLSVFDDD